MTQIRNPNAWIGILLVVLGAATLLVRVFDVSLGGVLWPLFLLVPGLLFFGAVAIWGRTVAGLAIPGSIVTTLGLIFLVQSLTGRFESWAYAWGLILASVGVGLVIHGILTDDPEPQRAGRLLATIGLALFAAFGLFFELLVFRGFGGSFVGRVILPLLLIGAGVLFLRRPSRNRTEGSPRDEGPGSGMTPKPQG